MLARLGVPSSKKKYEESLTGVHGYRKRYEEALLLPKRELQKLDLSPPKAKKHTYRHRLEDTKSVKAKELTDEENDAVWRRWKQTKERTIAKHKKEDNNALLSLELTAPTAAESDAGFQRWKERKREADRIEKQRKQAQQAEWAGPMLHGNVDLLQDKAVPSNQTPKAKKLPEQQALLQVLHKVQASPYSKPTRTRHKPQEPSAMLPQILQKARPLTSSTRAPKAPSAEDEKLISDNNADLSTLEMVQLPTVFDERIPRPTTTVEQRRQ
ncbi:hypothetical protein ACHHYP_03495 [Achlya hypogyna]|uniref:Uncharacterized protein n=1 Tax=Achlya hypogyna TaxID=1202772 RepID=A0A1V9Z3K4_ACHHY|nr:hypothetical protein ACHHYP_03495 [Achlya hypogyna]